MEVPHPMKTVVLQNLNPACNPHKRPLIPQVNNHLHVREIVHPERLWEITYHCIGNKKSELHNLIASSEPDAILGNETHLDPTTIDVEILPYNIPPPPNINTNYFE